MKAILVIDIPNENLWKTSNDIYERMKGYKCSFKPMPKKKETDSTGTIEEYMLKGYDRGWNECIEEIDKNVR